MRFISIILFGCLFVSASGRGIYVSVTGNDLNKGTHWFLPFRTLQKAANMAVGGDTVYIMKGDYYSDAEALIDFDKSGTENAWIVFKNYRNHQPVLQVKTKYGIHLNSCNYVSIEGLTIQTQKIFGTQTQLSDSITTGIYLDGTYEAPCNHIKLYNNFIKDHRGSAVMAKYYDYLTLSYNKFFKNATQAGGQATLELINGVFTDDINRLHSFIQSNTFEKNSVNDSSLVSSCSPVMRVHMAEKAESRYKSKVLIYNNIIYTNGSGAVWMENALGIDLINNSFYRNSENRICKHPEIQLIGSEYINVLNNIIYASDGKSGISSLVSREIVIKNNLQYNCISSEYGIGAIKSDPLFEYAKPGQDQFNFRLKGNSPAINAGLDSLISDTDYEGNKRKVDLHVDLGAIEFTNRILPSLKNFKTEIPSTGIKSYWSSLYTKDQKVYTVWNEENMPFYVKVYDFQGNVIREAKNEENAFEMDFNGLEPGFYTIQVFNEKSSHSDRIEIKKRL